MPRFFYPTRQHEEVLRACRQVIEHRQGLAVVLAPVGMGKTLLLRTLYEELFASAHDTAAFLPHPNYRTEYALMRGILQALRVTPGKKRSLHDLVDAFQRYVAEQVMQHRRTVVLMFDEAHEMRYRALRQVRRILDYHVDDQQMVQVILAGQPPLATKIARLPALRDRIVAQHTLNPLAPSDVKALITARLHEAGSRNGLFTPAAVRTITDLAHGRPRQITVACMRCLWSAFEQRRHVIDHEFVRRAVNGHISAPAEDEATSAKGQAPTGMLSRLRLLWHRDGSS